MQKEIVRKFLQLGKEILPKTREKRRKFELAKVEALFMTCILIRGGARNFPTGADSSDEGS